MERVIELHDLSAGWGPRCVIPSLCLEVSQGETLCIVGPGGSGKSTILHVLEGIHPGSSARPEGLWWRGRGRVRSRGCARLRQHGQFTREPVSQLLAAVGLEGEDAWMPEGAGERAALRAIMDLSLGEAPDPLRRFVSFALVAGGDAALLLLDEPLFGLAEPWAGCVNASLRRLADEGRTMVVVTHYLPLARALADRVMLVIDGLVVESAATEDFFCRAQHPRTRAYLEWGG
jgi:ABC-type glutathione transport system ATPase component